LLFFLCPVTDISATVAPIGVKFCMMVHIGPSQIYIIVIIITIDMFNVA